MPVSSTPRRSGPVAGPGPSDFPGAPARPGRDLPAAGEGRWTLSAAFPPQARALGPARRLVRAALAAWGAPGPADAAELVVSELVANAVRHGRGPVGLDLVLDRRGLWIAVTDRGPGLPLPREAADDECGGRGLAIVEALCAHWSVTTRLTGKTVECLLPSDGP